MNTKAFKFVCSAFQTIRLFGFTSPQGIPKSISSFTSHYSTIGRGFRCGSHLLRDLDDAVTLFHRMLKMNPQPPAQHFGQNESSLASHFSLQASASFGFSG